MSKISAMAALWGFVEEISSDISWEIQSDDPSPLVELFGAMCYHLHPHYLFSDIHSMITLVLDALEYPQDQIKKILLRKDLHQELSDTYMRIVAGKIKI